MSQLVGVEPLAQPLLERFEGVYVFDSSVISLASELSDEWPGCGQAASKSGAGLELHTGLELGSGRLLGPVLSAARVHDRSGPDQNRALPARALRICDLGYLKLGRLAELDEEQVYFLSRVQAGTKVRAEASPHQPGSAPAPAPAWQTLGEWLADQKGTRTGRGSAAGQLVVIDQWLEVGQSEKLKCRVVAWPVSEGVHLHLQRQAAFKEIKRKRQCEITPQQRRLSEWMVYVTTLPVELASPAELSVLYRMRWQIEGLFKVWKSGSGELEKWHSKKPQAILCEVYAKLIGVLVSHWSGLLGWEDEAEVSLVKVYRVVREHTATVLERLGQGGALEQELNYLKVALSQQARLEKGYKAHLSSFQLRLKPPLLI